MYHLQLCNVDTWGQQAVVVDMSNAYVFALNANHRRGSTGWGRRFRITDDCNHLILEYQLLTPGEVFAA